jgi:hypothetical protein
MHFSLMRRIFLPVPAKRFRRSGRQGICRQRTGIASRFGARMGRKGAGFEKLPVIFAVFQNWPCPRFETEVPIV